MVRKGKVIPFRRRKPEMVTVICPKCGRVRYFPRGEELYVDENGRKSVRRCDRC